MPRWEAAFTVKNKVNVGRPSGGVSSQVARKGHSEGRYLQDVTEDFPDGFCED